MTEEITKAAEIGSSARHRMPSWHVAVVRLYQLGDVGGEVSIRSL
jgi:hypothetical protein